MLTLQRFTPYWTSLVVAVTFWYGIQYPQSWGAVMALLASVVLVALIILHQPQWRHEYLGLGLTATVLLLSAYAFMLIQESALVIYSTLGVCTLVYFFFIKNVTVYVCEPARYIPYSLQHISIYATILSSFLFYVSIFIFYILQITHLRYLLGMTALVTALLVWQTMWSQKIIWQRSRSFVAIITIVITELIWLLHFWPVSFWVSGFTATLAFYVLLHLARHYLTETLTRIVLWRYLGVSVAALILLYSTARWF